jgi:putative spermidine/putrescine transport system ATP-binding protein
MGAAALRLTGLVTGPWRVWPPNQWRVSTPNQGRVSTPNQGPVSTPNQGRVSTRRQAVRARGELDGLDLDPEPGLLTAVLGPRGSGKSALIRAAAGVQAMRGRVELDGVNLSRTAPHQRLFGVVLQPDVLFPHLRLSENVDFPLRMRRTPSDGRARLVAEALEAMQLGHLASRYPAEVSEAERQRAILARAVVASPRVLLLDEPLGAQDPAMRAWILASLRRLHLLMEGTTTLLATSSRSDALAVADRVAVLRRGVVAQYGTPEELYERPVDAFVAAQLGETNALPGRVVELADDLARVRLDCGPMVDVRMGPGLAERAPCMVVLRPDRIAIAPVRAAEMGEGAIDATLIDTQYQGETNRLRMLIGSGAEIVVRRPSTVGLRGLSVGATVAIAWQPHQAWAFSSEGGASL